MCTRLPHPFSDARGSHLPLNIKPKPPNSRRCSRLLSIPLAPGGVPGCSSPHYYSVLHSLIVFRPLSVLFSQTTLCLVGFHQIYEVL